MLLNGFVKVPLTSPTRGLILRPLCSTSLYALLTSGPDAQGGFERGARLIRSTSHQWFYGHPLHYPMALFSLKRRLDGTGNPRQRRQTM